MIGIGSVLVYSARVQPVMERILARRLDHAASDTREAPRREGVAAAIEEQDDGFYEMPALQRWPLRG